MSRLPCLVSAEGSAPSARHEIEIGSSRLGLILEGMSDGKPEDRLQRMVGRWLSWALGLSTLVALLHHLSVQWAALEGPTAWSLRQLEVGAARPVLLWLLVVYGLAAAWRGLRCPACIWQSPRLWGTGSCAVLGGVVHGVYLRSLTVGAHAWSRDAYEWLWVHMGQGGWLLLHLVGCGAVVLHVGLLAACAQRMLGLHAVQFTWFIWLACGMLFVCLVQLLSWFALGEPLLVLKAVQHACCAR